MTRHVGAHVFPVDRENGGAGPAAPRGRVPGRHAFGAVRSAGACRSNPRTVAPRHQCPKPPAAHRTHHYGMVGSCELPRFPERDLTVLANDAFRCRVRVLRTRMQDVVFAPANVHGVLQPMRNAANGRDHEEGTRAGWRRDPGSTRRPYSNAGGRVARRGRDTNLGGATPCVCRSNVRRETFSDGASLTAPDAYLFVMLSWAHRLAPDLTPWHRLSGYYARVADLPSVCETLVLEGPPHSLRPQ